MPRSIWWFERALWTALAIDLANNVAAWPQLAAALIAQGITPNPVLMAASCVLSPAIGLVLWYLIARRRSVVGKWIFVALVAIAVAGFLYGLSRPIAAGAGWMIGIAALTEALKVFAATRLFTGEAARWFAGQQTA